MNRITVYVYPEYGTHSTVDVYLEYGTHSVERRSFSTKQRADKFIKRLCRRKDMRVHVEQGDAPQ